MPPPTREQVNALIERLKDATCSGSLWALMPEMVSKLLALQAENDRLRAQASPAWVATKDRAAIADSTPVGGYVIGGSWRCGQWDVSSAFEKGRLSSIDEDRTHFLIIPAPPESAADRQRREDEEALEAAWVSNGVGGDTGRYANFCKGFRIALAHARKEALP